MINSVQKYDCVGDNHGAISNEKEENGTEIENNKILEVINATGIEIKFKQAEKKDMLDNPHLILLILEVLIFIVAAALIYSFSKYIYNKIQKRNEITLVGSGTSKDF